MLVASTLEKRKWATGSVKPTHIFHKISWCLTRSLLNAFFVSRSSYTTQNTTKHLFNSTAEAAALSGTKGLLPGSTTSSTLAITPGPSSAPHIVASDTSPPIPSNTAVSTSGSDLLLASELLSLPQGNNAFHFFSDTDLSLSPMDDNSSLPTIPTLPILPQPHDTRSPMDGTSSLPNLPILPQPHDMMYSLREFLQDLPSHEHVPEHYQLPNVPVPNLTGAGDAFNPNQAVAQPNPYYPTEPTFIFTPTQSFAGGSSSFARLNQSPLTVEASPIALHLNQSPPAAEAASPIAPCLNQSPPAAEASPIAPASTGGEKRGCEPCEGEQSDVPTKCQKAKDGTRHRTASETMPTNLQDG